MNTVHTAPERGSPEQLAAIDLNLLVAFDALARERSVTRAAERVGVTQSAMSHALGRLRDLLGDPLLVRGSGGMTLTARAEALVVPLRSGLVTLGRALAEPPVFEPAAVRRAFRVASPDLFDVLAVPRVLERIRSEAPGVDLGVAPVNDRRLGEALETGEIDAAVVPEVSGLRTQPAELGGGLVRRTLLRDRFVCYLRADHPALGARSAKVGARSLELSLAAYVQASHAVVSPSGAGPGLVDHALEQRGLARRVALRIPHFYSALAITATSDLILTAPSALAQLVPEGSPLVVLPSPLPLPEHSLQLVWHERFSSDPGQRWLRDMLADVARSIETLGRESVTAERKPGLGPRRAALAEAGVGPRRNSLPTGRGSASDPLETKQRRRSPRARAGRAGRG
jgi:DNA-binding transcriptional LysR family regulator